MTAAPHLLWEWLGRPAFSTDTTARLVQDRPGDCAVCGQRSDRTADCDRALGANFADRSHLMGLGSRVCPGCLWCCSGKPPATLRMWSIAATEDGGMPPSHPKAWMDGGDRVCLTNRANPAPIRDLLMRGADGLWIATVAYSGQKHVIPYSPVNRGRDQWTIRVEDHHVTSSCEQFRHVHHHADALRRMGVPEEAVMAGEPAFIKTADQLAAWREHNAALTPHLGTPLLRLALWTITKGTMQ